VRRQLTTPYTHQQNGVVERRNQTVVGTARSMLKAKGLQGMFWAEAVATAVYVLNRSPTKGVAGMTPYEAWHRRKSVVHHLHAFGCVVYVRNTTPNLKKLDDRSHPMIFVRYEQGTKGYRVYDPSTQRVRVSRDVVFDDQAKWQWGETKVSDNSASDTFIVEYDLSREQVMVDGADVQEEEPVQVDGVHEAGGDDSDQGQDEYLVSENLDADHGDSVPVRVRRLDDIVAELDNQEPQLHMLSSDEPATFDEAEPDPWWRRAMEEDISSIEENET
jgi:hypothetical protein